ncbi:MAG: hypothetical protein ACKOGE_08820, partial [Actinomycetota bacterium]
MNRPYAPRQPGSRRDATAGTTTGGTTTSGIATLVTLATLGIAGISTGALGLGGTALASSQAPGGTAASPAASSAGSVRFLVKGDWGTGSSAQAAISKGMCASHAATPASFILTTGDHYSSPDGTATRASFDRPEACLLATGLPWRATWGNHDLGGNSTA